ncbi:MAG: COX15/CtaA family protein [Verrucomicrobia bacterium]|nr:COX15/CtaA family protein [Verrucomicrobiota bacterium]
MQKHSLSESRGAIIVWLAIVCALIVTMIGVGGITRLTESGLSMVEWKPILGTIPPLSDSAWNEKFDQYRQHAEFRLRNADMSLSEFKSIFFWEYLHRLLGRGIGVVYLVPFLYFSVRRRLTTGLFMKLAIGFVWGGAQGVLGWYMVRSGLAENPYVSHYRLVAHLMVALFLLGYLFWIMLDLVPRTRDRMDGPVSSPKTASLLFLLLVSIQCGYGAFVAGLDAGKSYNTFPKMLGHWLAPGWNILQPMWRNFFDNVTLVQFMHRTLGWTVLFFALGLWLFGVRKHFQPGVRRAINLIGGFALAQFFLGMLTLIYAVPLVPAVMHQVLASILLCATVYLVHASFHRPITINHQPLTINH